MIATAPVSARVALGLLLPAFLASQDVDALYRDGLRLFSEHQAQAAIEALRQTVAIQPGHALAWKALGVVFASQGDYERAETPFRNACERQPSLEGACLYFGRALYLL